MAPGPDRLGCVGGGVVKLEDKLRWFVVVLMVVAALMVLTTRAEADDGHGHDHHDDGGSTVTTSTDIINDLAGGDIIGGDTSVITGNNKALTVVAPGLGDVDIAQCLGSEAWTLLVGGKQKLVLNQVCMAEFYLKQGRYDLAAQSLCNQPEIVREYDTEAACELAHDFTPPITSEPASNRSLEEQHSLETHHDEDLDMVQAQLSEVQMQLAELEERPAPRPRVAQAVPPDPEPKYSDEQFNAVWAALKGGDEDE